jgi:hypothetical protein
MKPIAAVIASLVCFLNSNLNFDSIFCGILMVLDDLFWVFIRAGSFNSCLKVLAMKNMMNNKKKKKKKKKLRFTFFFRRSFS